MHSKVSILGALIEKGNVKMANTYHNGYTSTLHKSTKDQQRSHNLPPGTSPLHSTGDDDAEAHQSGELQYDGEVDQEPDCPPEVAERLPPCHAPRILWEGRACFYAAGAAFVEAECYLALVVLLGRVSTGI